jgi:hypothetical protein
MKKILAALAMAGFSFFNANAQQPKMKACEKKPDKVCRVSADKKSTSCYKTSNAQSFAVCKNEQGYYICCETPGDYNTTYSRAAIAIGATPDEATGYEAHPGTNAPGSKMKKCAKSPDKVCRLSADKKTTSCYKTKNAQSFEVCKNAYGYYICCEAPGDNNTTYPGNR